MRRIGETYVEKDEIIRNRWFKGGATNGGGWNVML